MSFGNILGQILQDGLGGQGVTRDRVSQSAQSLGGAGGGIQDIFNQLQGALGGGGGASGTTANLGAEASSMAGGFAEKAKEFLGKDQVGGLSGAQIGGIGAVAGALLGGGLGGAARGGAMAVLGTLALGALKRAQQARAGAAAEPVSVKPEEVTAVTGPGSAQLALRAMISAAKADGQIDQGEMEKIIGKLGADSVTDSEKQFVISEIRAPIDVAGLAAEAKSPAQAAQIYAASLLAISVDTDKEKGYMAQLAQALRLDDATVAQLHEMTGAPVAA